MKACKESGITVDTTRDAAAFTIENLKKYKVVVFLNTTGDVLDNGQQEAFIKYIQSGGGFVGVHAATDTEYDWPWYNKLVGAYFLSHPSEQQEAVINVVDKTNPATAMLPDKWKRTDEWYNFKDISTDIHVLAYLDETTYNGVKTVKNILLYGTMNLTEDGHFIRVWVTAKIITVSRCCSSICWEPSSGRENQISEKIKTKNEQ